MSWEFYNQQTIQTMRTLSKPIPQKPSLYGNQTKPRYDEMLEAEYMLLLPLFLKEYIWPF